jgi:transposase-like protein
LTYDTSAKRDGKAAARFFRKVLKAQHTQTPCVINVDKNAAYPVAMDTLQGDETVAEETAVPTDIVFQVLLCRLRYKLSFRDIAEFFLLQGFKFTHETVRDWEERFAGMFAEQLHAKRQGKIGKIWFVDETYIRV